MPSVLMGDEIVATWQFEPDWSNDFTTDYEFRTEIITSRDGTEQRIATRDKARVSYTFSTLVDDYDFRNFAGFANSWQARPVLMPEWTRLIEVGAAATIGQSSVTVASTDDWLVEGANVSITWGDRSLSQQAIMSVESVVGSTVTFTAPLTADIPADAIITPMFYGRLDSTITAKHNRERTATVDVKFAVDPGYEQQIVSEAPSTYDGRELFMLEPDLSTEMTSDFTSMLETLDYGYGRMTHFTPITYNDRVTKMTHLGVGRVEIDALRDLFLRQRGQQGEFFMPTFSEDLRMRSSLGAGQSTMRVLGAEVFENYANLKVFRHICIIMRDGTSHRFKVSEINSITDSQGTDSTLTLQSAATSTINPVDVFMVCWLPLWRFVSDKLSVQWRSDQVASVSYSMKTIPYVTAEA